MKIMIHEFILKPGIWLGEGIVKVSAVKEDLKFFTRWNIAPMGDPGQIECLQEIQIGGVSDIMLNQFSFYPIDSSAFKIELENQNLGVIVGEGVIKPQVIAWEFRMKELGFEGFEMYDLQEDGSYFLHAEYTTKDDFRTKIQGKIWKKMGK